MSLSQNKMLAKLSGFTFMGDAFPSLANVVRSALKDMPPEVDVLLLAKNIAFGKHILTPSEYRALCAALGIDINVDAEVADLVKRLEEQRDEAEEGLRKLEERK